MEKKIYCGSGKKRSENWISATINLDKIKEHIQEYNGSKFIKVNINVKAEPDQYGKDIAITIDTWKPEEKSKSTSDNNSADYLPF